MEHAEQQAPVEVRRHGLLEELKELFGPAFGPALETLGRLFAERLGRDEGFLAEVRDRFERGRALGGFPKLSALLSDMTPTQQDEFFVTGWTRLIPSPPGPPTDPWNRPPWAGDRKSYREDLYAGLAFASDDLRTLAGEWLEELLRVGYHGMEQSSGLPLKQRAGTFSPASEFPPLSGESRPVRLEGTRQTIWLDLYGPRSEEGGYREIAVSEEPLRTDGAVFAALATLEGRRVDLSQLREVLHELVPSHGESVWDRWTRLTREDGKAEILHSLHHQTLDYLLLLLRHHRPGFDDAPHEERASLLADTCAYLNDFLQALKKFMAFVEYGVSGRGPVSAVRTVARDVKAAVLKDVESLTYKEIGDRLGVPPPVDFSYKGDHAAVRKMVGRGRTFLTDNLGDEGYASQVGAMKEEARRWQLISDAERQAEDLAQSLSVHFQATSGSVEQERGQPRETEKPGKA